MSKKKHNRLLVVFLRLFFSMPLFCCLIIVGCSKVDGTGVSKTSLNLKKKIIGRCEEALKSFFFMAVLDFCYSQCLLLFCNMLDHDGKEHWPMAMGSLWICRDPVNVCHRNLSA